jgi:hypothetical protein
MSLTASNIVIWFDSAEDADAVLENVEDVFERVATVTSDGKKTLLIEFGHSVYGDAVDLPSDKDVEYLLWNVDGLDEVVSKINIIYDEVGRYHEIIGLNR